MEMNLQIFQQTVIHLQQISFFQGSDLNGQLIGKSNGSEYLDGCLSHYHCVVGTVYTPSTFGETDSTTGEWKIKTSVGISTANYGAAWFLYFRRW